MATGIESLMGRAMEVQRRLEEQGAVEDAKIVEQLLGALVSSRPKRERPYYTVSEAADLIGVSGQTIKNWISRSLLKGYRLGGRIVIPRTELDDYRPIAEAFSALEPTPSDEEIVEEIRAGRRRFIWRVEPKEHQGGNQSRA
jgi:excisionase family DNA binding protein